MENSNDKDWLVESRSRIQCLLLELYKFLKDNRGKLVQRKFERSVFGLLVGTAFSLWRAAFLVSQADRDWPNILKQAEDFLDILVEDNAINYPQDKKRGTGQWGTTLTTRDIGSSESEVNLPRLLIQASSHRYRNSNSSTMFRSPAA